MGPLVIAAASWSHVIVAGALVVLALPALLAVLVLLDRRLR